MKPETSSKNQLKVENHLRLNWIQNLTKESGRVQGFTIDMQEVSQLLPNKLPKRLNQLNIWKIRSTKILAETNWRNQLKAEETVRLN